MTQGNQRTLDHEEWYIVVGIGVEHVAKWWNSGIVAHITA